VEGTILNQYAKLAASGALFGSLFYLVLTGKIQASDYQTLAVGALGAVGGWHARSSGKPADHIPDAGKMVSTETPHQATQEIPQ